MEIAPLKYSSVNSSVQEIFENSYIICGSTQGSKFLLKLSKDYYEEWKFLVGKNVGFCCGTSNNNIIFFDGEESLFINGNNGQLIKSDKNFYFFNKNQIKVYLDLANKEILNLVCNEKQFSINYENANRFLFDDYLITQPNSNDCIKCNNVCDENQNWEVRYSEIFMSDSYCSYINVINYDDKIFFYLEGQNEVAKTCALDMKTGEILYSSGDMKGFLTLDNEKIYSISHYHVNIINPNNFDLQQIDLEDLLRKEDLYLSWDRYKIRDGYLYFTDTYKPVFGIIDLEKKELLWKESIEIENENLKVIMGIRLNKNNIIIDSSDGSLYIYEIGALIAPVGKP